jgi:hypothetical protein
MIESDAAPKLGNLKKAIKNAETQVLGDLRPYWEDYATPAVIEEIARIFITEGYGTWARLHPDYARSKQRSYPGKTMLRATDAYFRASTRRGEGGNIAHYTKDYMEWGAELAYFEGLAGFPYPIVHEKGSSRHPQRAVYGLAEESDSLQNALVDALGKWLKKRVEEELDGVL